MQRMRRAYRPRRLLFEHLLENINVLTLFNSLTSFGRFFYIQYLNLDRFSKTLLKIRYITMKVEINIPETMSEVTLGQYQKFLKIQENNTDERFLQIKMIEIFCNVPSEYVLNMRLSDTNEIVSMLNELFSDKQKLIQRTKIGGKEYGFIPKLEDISLGEYIDLDTYLGSWENMHLAMQVLYRPVKNKYGERYSIEDYKASDGLHMKDITLDCVMGSILFFYALGTDLSKAILNSSQAEKENLIVRYLNSEVNGVGISQYTHSLSVMLQDLNISLN